MVIIGMHSAMGFDGNSENWVHGSGASLIVNGVLIGAASEERFTRVKYEGNFPFHSIDNLLIKANKHAREVDYVALAATRQLCLTSYNEVNAVTMYLRNYFPNAKIVIYEHHTSHAAASFFTSNFNEANILSIDASGEVRMILDESLQNWGIFGVASREDPFITTLSSFYARADNYARTPNVRKRLGSIGEFYNSLSIVVLRKHALEIGNYDTGILDFQRVREGASGKVMGLNAYGKDIDFPKNIFRVVKQSKHEMPTIELDIDFMDRDFHNELFNRFSAADIALWIQQVYENIVIEYIKAIPKSMKKDYLVMSGGCALNISLNSRILREGLYKDIHINTAPGDEGLGLGASLLLSYELGQPVSIPTNIGCIGNSYPGNSLEELGIVVPEEFKNVEIQQQVVSDEVLYDFISRKLIFNHTVAWFQGESEFGPRALGNRSIFVSPCFDNKEILNTAVKKREYWRPYAAIVMEEHCHNWFDLPKKDSHYMLFNSFVKEDKKIQIPGVTHVDGTCRIQTVNQQLNARAYNLLKSFYEKTEIPLLLNTSFNTLRGEPIVETPQDAFISFLNSKIDYLVINNTIFTRGPKDNLDTKGVI